MLPPVGPLTFPSPPSPPARDDGVAALPRGTEPSAARIPAETARAVDPARAATLVIRTPDRLPARQPLVPPDPDAPTGPPPAFDSSPLEQTYERLRSDAIAPIRAGDDASRDSAGSQEERRVDVVT